MFAVIKTGGKQYKVAAGDTITAMTLPGLPGDTIAFEHVLMLVREGHTDIGAPYVTGASVAAEIVEHKRGDKVIAFKKRRRQNSKRKRGHKQDLTVVRITEFLTGGAKAKVTTHAAPLLAVVAPAPAAVAHAPAAPAAMRTVTLASTPVAARTSAEAVPAEGGKSARIAAGAAAGAAAAKAAGHDITKFKKLDAAIGTADDIELIGGIGPAIARKLNSLGIYHFWQVAAMAAEDIAAVEHEVGFAGRAERDEWKAQAVELLDGKGPRAKVDQERAAAKKPK